MHSLHPWHWLNVTGISLSAAKCNLEQKQYPDKSSQMWRVPSKGVVMGFKQWDFIEVQVPICNRLMSYQWEAWFLSAVISLLQWNWIIPPLWFWSDLFWGQYWTFCFNFFRTATRFFRLWQASLQDQYLNFMVRLMQSKSHFQRWRLICLHSNTVFFKKKKHIIAYYIVCIHTKFGRDLSRKYKRYRALSKTIHFLSVFCEAGWFRSAQRHR